MRKAGSATLVPQKRRRFKLPSTRTWLLWGGGIIVIVAIAVVVWLFWPGRDAVTEGESEAQMTMKKVSRHYLLPGDEKPALATVTDKNKLSSPVFKGTEDGDKILIYQTNKLAIVYRPSKDRIVAVVPVTIDEPTNITKQGGQ